MWKKQLNGSNSFLNGFGGLQKMIPMLYCHQRGGKTMIGNVVKVTVDRPLGTCHPRHPDIMYPINYGYIPGVMAPDGEEQDVYILGVHEPVREFVGKVIAIIHRFDDVEEKWVVAPEDTVFTEEEIMEQVAFQEQYFQTEIRMK
jgi:inorganic pyrophosphatase